MKRMKASVTHVGHNRKTFLKNFRKNVPDLEIRWYLLTYGGTAITIKIARALANCYYLTFECYSYSIAK